VYTADETGLYWKALLCNCVDMHTARGYHKLLLHTTRKLKKKKQRLKKCEKPSHCMYEPEEMLNK
jgi:hypothetical protein